MNEANMNEPKPCPFCGNKSIKAGQTDETFLAEAEASGGWHAICMGCTATGPEAATPDDAYALWNRRHQTLSIHSGRIGT